MIFCDLKGASAHIEWVDSHLQPHKRALWPFFKNEMAISIVTSYFPEFAKQSMCLEYSCPCENNPLMAYISLKQPVLLMCPRNGVDCLDPFTTRTK